MSLKFSTSGRPMIECINPECRKLHAIHRRGDYVQRTQLRVSCRGCGTKWQLNEQDKTILQNHYQQRQQELEEKKREKERKNQENSKQNQNVSKPMNQEKSTKKTEQDKPLKKNKQGWLDELLS
jgi:hypothetical protein